MTPFEMRQPPRPLPQAGVAPPGPPLGLPLALLGQAVLWLLLGAAGLVVIAPDLAAGLTVMPRVFAVTHLFTLGVLGAASLGALHQFIPVVTGVELRHPRVTAWVGPVHFAGVAALTGGMWWWSPAGQLAGWGLLFVAVGLGSWNILPARRRARQNAYVAGFVSLAHSALGLAMALALVRIGDGMGWWHTWREGQLVAHFHLGWLGYGTLLIAGIGSKMLPAFLGLPEHADTARAPRAYRWVGWLLSSGLVALAAGAPFRIGGLTAVASVLLAAGVALHLRVLVGYLARRRGSLDPALLAITASVVGYAAAGGLGLWAALAPRAGGRLWAAYGLAAIVGWLTLMIVGVMLRIGPRLLTGYLAGRGGRLTLAERGGQVLDARLAWGSVVFLVLGTGSLVPATLAGWAAGATTAAVACLAGATLLAAQAARLFRQVAKPRG